MRTIGIIGGLGPQATMDFEARVHAVSQTLIPQHENQGYPPMLTWYLRHPPMRCDGIGNHRDLPFEPHPHLLEAAAHLGRLTDFLVIPSNTPHLFLQQIEQSAGREVLSMIDLVMREIKRRSAKRIGILAIGFTLQHRLYQDSLEEAGMSWETIEEDMASDLDRAIFNFMQGKGSSDNSAVAFKAVQSLRKKNVDCIVLGCTEVPLLLGEQILATDLINPVQLLAEAAVKYALVGSNDAAAF